MSKYESMKETFRTSTDSSWSRHHTTVNNVTLLSVNGLVLGFNIYNEKTKESIDYLIHETEMRNLTFNSGAISTMFKAYLRNKKDKRCIEAMTNTKFIDSQIIIDFFADIEKLLTKLP